jgi:hypothetical protein
MSKLACHFQRDWLKVTLFGLILFQKRDLGSNIFVDKSLRLNRIWFLLE